MTVRLSNPTEELSARVSARRLTPEVVERLARLLVEGRTRKQIAEQLGVSVRTVDRRKAHPLVLAEAERYRSRSDEVRAADVLVKLMESDDERVALRAAELVLQHETRRTPLKSEAPPPASAVVLKIEGKPEDIAAAADEIVIENGEIVG